jgi:hypothetical protein
MKEKTSIKGRNFLIELTSKKDLKNITLANCASDHVVLEGTIGEFVKAGFEEGVILEILGKNGTIRIDLEESEITDLSEVRTR